MKLKKTRAKSNASRRKRGGMWRVAAKRGVKKALEEMIGKNPVEKADKAKQVADAVQKGLTTRSQSTSVTPRTHRTFSTPNAIMRMHTDDLTTSISPIELQKLYQTPVKGNLNNDDNVNPTKFSRHQSTLTPQSYAPTLNDPNLVVKTLFSGDENELS
jgi:hypothetical protein